MVPANQPYTATPTPVGCEGGACPIQLMDMCSQGASGPLPVPGAQVCAPSRGAGGPRVGCPVPEFEPAP